MIRVAIVEDDAAEARALGENLNAYCKENGVAVEIESYNKPLAFLSGKNCYDAVFMDIEMPGINGLDAAAKLRNSDDSVIIVFVTHMAQFAAQGYKVDATDFIVKPVKYAEIVSVMRRIMRRLSVRKKSTHTIKSQTGVMRVDISEIVFVEVYKHRLCYHMVNGETYDAWGTLKELEDEFPANQFARCNNCYLVNLQFVRAVKDNIAYVGDEHLEISRPRKQEFINRLVAFAGE